MICAVTNTASAPRAFYDVGGREIVLAPGAERHADIDDGTYLRLTARGDLIVRAEQQPVPAPVPVVVPMSSAEKTPISVTGHFGIGDNLHQRALIRALLPAHHVWLHTCHFNLYHDLIVQGLNLVMRPTHLHAQAKTIQRERELFAAAKFPAQPANARQFNIGYPKVLIDQHGSILEAMFSCVGMKMPERPDFSLPIKPEWRERIKGAIGQWRGGNSKPLMVHRPIVVRREWNGRSRNPDPAAYDELYRSIRDQYFVISLADLRPGEEWIDGPQQDADLRLHKGELSFTEMAALFAEADLIFCNAGFAPVLAQAVGTPVVVVYGGRESFRTTQRVGVHLAPTLPIDPVRPCDCHSANHACDKHIDVRRAKERLAGFVDQRVATTLLFGTFYVDSPDRDNLTELWKTLHCTLNEQDCDLLAVDSQSPIKKFNDWTPYDGKRHRRMYFNFPDNVGHLSRARVTAGRDGWGRAFCKGLEIACELGYEYVAHVEGDSLFRLRVSDVTKQMKAEGIDCASTDVTGMRTPGLDKQWIETGLMFFSTSYVKRSNFIARYDWPNRKVAPTPERYIRMQILQRDLGPKQLRIMPWRAQRADKNQINKDNILSLNLDWVTHQHDSAQQDVYRKFVEAALGKEVVPADNREPKPTVTAPQLKRLNLGCGTNKLQGWENHDADVDITKRLPWNDNTASHISIEHCVEHVAYKSAISFFREAHRVLVPGGVLRVTVPSLEQIAKCDEADYHRFTTKWQQVGPTKRGAMHAIIYSHGHETVWNAQLMRDTLFFAGFEEIRQVRPGESDDPVLRGVEGHGKVIGDKFNLIESCTHEARKAAAVASVVAAAQRPPLAASVDLVGPEIAVIIGGAECWLDDVEQAKRLLVGRRIKYFLVNDQIKSFPEPGIACTLHPDKLNGHASWLAVRQRAGLPAPEQIWSHRKHAAVTHDTASMEWAGSSGLFAVMVAHRSHAKVIGCGIPMTVDGSHFERHQKWQSAISFREGWTRHKADIAKFFRSLSGWTADTFGKPDESWLRE